MAGYFPENRQNNQLAGTRMEKYSGVRKLFSLQFPLTKSGAEGNYAIYNSPVDSAQRMADLLCWVLYCPSQHAIRGWYARIPSARGQAMQAPSNGVQRDAISCAVLLLQRDMLNSDLMSKNLYKNRQEANCLLPMGFLCFAHNSGHLFLLLMKKSRLPQSWKGLSTQTKNDDTSRHNCG